MNRRADAGKDCHPQADRPYAMLGAGKLAASVWKTGNEQIGWRYWFEVCRMSEGNRRVTQYFAPSDLGDLVKLAQVLAFTLADDGCMDATLRRELRRLATGLDRFVPLEMDRAEPLGECDGQSNP